MYQKRAYNREIFSICSQMGLQVGGGGLIRGGGEGGGGAYRRIYRRVLQYICVTENG